MKDSSIDLPTEILCQVLAYLIPINRSFRIKSRRSLTHHRDGPHAGLLDHEVEFYSWADKKSGDWSHRVGYGCPDALTLLLLHRNLYPIVLKQLYGSNTLWFPDLETFRLFTTRFSAAIKNAINTLAVDACGIQFVTRGCARSSTLFEHPAELGISDIVTEYPELRDLRLGGVGPCFTNLMDVSSLWADHTYADIKDVSEYEPDSVEWTNGNSSQDGGTPRLPWSFDCIGLIALIVGAASRHRSEGGDMSASRSDDYGSASTRSSHLLRHGRVFYYQVKDQGPNIFGPGRFRWAGTRITRREDNVELSPLEFEVTNVAELLRRARLTHVEYVAILRRCMIMQGPYSESLAESQSNKKAEREEKDSTNSEDESEEGHFEEENCMNQWWHPMGIR